MDLPAARVAYEFGEFHVDATQRLLRTRSDGEPVPLTSKAFETLLYLVEHPGELVDKTTLMKAVWPNVVVEENNLNQSISALRRALGETALEHRFIVTVPGRGYRFVAPVKTLTTSAEPTERPEATPPAAAPDSSSDQSSEARFAGPLAWFTSRRIAILAVVALLLAGGLWLFSLSRFAGEGWGEGSLRSPGEPTTESADSAAKLRLAVLPFENLSPDPANAFFTDGLHEEILSTLARRAPDLEVISRTTMMGYRIKPKPVQEVAQEMQASHVLEGSVRREQQKVRLTLQLIDARNDRYLWSHNYDRTLSDALTLQSDVASEVASQLSVQLAGGMASAAGPPKNAEAYDLYLKGLMARQFVSPLAPVERYLEVEDLFSRAIALDPSFASAYAQRSTFRGAMFAFNYDVSEDQVRRIREDLNAALKLAPDDPLVLAAEALYWSWVERDLPRALATFEAAEAARLADPMFLSGKTAILLRMRRGDEAQRLNERLMAIDPGNPFILSNAVSMMWLTHHPAEALRTAKRALEQFPDNSTLEFVRGQMIFAHTGRTDEWRVALERASRNTPRVALLDQHFNLLRNEHRYAELQTLLDQIAEPSTRVIAGVGAGSLFGVGNRPTALYRGWLALLLGDSAAAATHGRGVVEFVADQKETARNAWFLRLLKAQGHTFLAQRERAIAAAREALELMPPTRDALSWLSAAVGAAAAYAWSGAEDEAATLLEELSTATPGAGPAWITRDPTYNVPLAKNPRYRALADRLEAQVRSSELEGL